MEFEHTEDAREFFTLSQDTPGAGPGGPVDLYFESTEGMREDFPMMVPQYDDKVPRIVTGENDKDSFIWAAVLRVYEDRMQVRPLRNHERVPAMLKGQRVPVLKMRLVSENKETCCRECGKPR